MEGLKAEVENVVKNNYCLKFKIPTQDELDRLRKIHRDMTPQEKRKIQNYETNLKTLIRDVETGEIALENLPTDLRQQLEKLFGGNDVDS